MSGLLSGAGDCSASANPLAQFNKQVSGDRSLQQDRFYGPAATNVHRAVREQRLEPAQSLDGFVNQNEFDQLANDHNVRAEETYRQSRGPVHNGWDSQFENAWGSPRGAEAQIQQDMGNLRLREPSPQVQPNGLWKLEFQNFRSTAGPHQSSYRGSMGNMYSGPYGAQTMQSFGSRAYAQPTQASAPISKGKNRVVELSDEGWEEQFRLMDEAAAPEEKAQDQEIGQSDQNEQNMGDFESIWRGIQQEALSNGQDIDNLDNLAQEWQKEFSGLEDESNAKPNLGEYRFEPDNPFLSHQDPFDDGVWLLEHGGSLSQAALAFEAAVQQSDGSRQEAWTQLGIVQASNEKEDPAIRALENAVNLGENDLQAMMALAVSYTNESYEAAAYITLERWIQSKYPGLMPPSVSESGSLTRDQIHARVINGFLSAARKSPEGTTMDADVQVGLGVLFYASDEYQKAVDCFMTALRVRPQDHLLWNRLGATLANSGKSEDAINAYNEALSLKPTFVRARYNLGVSCINIGCYEQAAQHLLGALSMHQLEQDRSGGVNISSTLWETLRRVFLVGLDRRDLAEKAVSGTDVAVFRNDFDF